MMLWRNTLKEKCVCLNNVQSGNRQKRFMASKRSALREGDLQQVFPPESLSIKKLRILFLFAIVGTFLTAGSFTKQILSETRLLSETSVEWDLRVASSEVSIEQTRSGTSCKKSWWYLPEEKTANENSRATVVGNLYCPDGNILGWRCPRFPGIWKEGVYLAQLAKQFSYSVWNTDTCDFIIAGPGGFEAQSNFLTSFHKMMTREHIESRKAEVHMLNSILRTQVQQKSGPGNLNSRWGFCTRCPCLQHPRGLISSFPYSLVGSVRVRVHVHIRACMHLRYWRRFAKC